MEVEKTDKVNSVLTLRDELCHVTHIPLVINKIAFTFQHVMDFILFSVKLQFSLAHPGDIPVSFQAPHQHIGHTGLVIILPWETNAAFKLRKWASFTNKIDYFGHVVHPYRFEVTTYTINSIVDLNILKSETKLRSFISFCNIFRLFVPYFALTKSLLAARMSKTHPKELRQLSEKEPTTRSTLGVKLIISLIPALLKKRDRKPSI